MYLFSVTPQLHSDDRQSQEKIVDSKVCHYTVHIQHLCGDTQHSSVVRAGVQPPIKRRRAGFTNFMMLKKPQKDELIVRVHLSFFTYKETF